MCFNIRGYFFVCTCILLKQRGRGIGMAMDDKKVTKPKVQNLILENREKLSISGVIDVESFNDECVIVETELGGLIIRGEDLHISKLNLDSSELNIEGEIISCEYTDNEGSRSGGLGFFGRIFR